MPHAPPPLESLSDEELVEAYRSGRADAFTVLVGRYEQELFHFLVRFLGGRPQAQDVFQEAFLQVHLSIESFDTDRRFRPWLFTIAANKARDWLRRHSQRNPTQRIVSLDAESDRSRNLVDLLQADLPDPGRQLADRETAEKVREVIAQMPDYLREILLLAYFQRFAYKEIADMLGLPLGTVKSRLHSAVATFAQLWNRHHEPEA
jgi:RNA polymerase sigma-70 factor (ECF subfamily)